MVDSPDRVFAYFLVTIILPFFFQGHSNIMTVNVLLAEPLITSSGLYLHSHAAAKQNSDQCKMQQQDMLAQLAWIQKTNDDQVFAYVSHHIATSF